MSKLEHAGASTTVAARCDTRERRAHRIAPSTPRVSTRTSCSQAPARPAAPLRRSPRPHRLTLTQRRGQLTEVAALVAAADDRDQAGVHALDRPARRLDVGRLRVVDEPHAVDLAGQLHRVLEAVEPARPPSSSPPAVAPAVRLIAVAATTSLRMWRPGTCTADRPARAASRPRPRRSTIAPASDVKPSPRQRRARSRRAAPSRRPRAPARRASSAFTTAQSSGVLVAGRSAPSLPRTPRPTGADRGDRARSSAAAAIHGWNVSVASSWKLLASTTCSVSGGRVVDLIAQRHADVAADRHPESRRSRASVPSASSSSTSLSCR